MSEQRAVNLGRALQGVGFADSLASREATAMHALAPSVKMAATFVYIAMVVSFGPYDFSGIIPFAAYPVAASAVLGIPLFALLKRAAVALPFVAFAGLANIIFDDTSFATPFGFAVGGGFISAAVLVLKAMLCVSAALILAASTPINEIASGMLKFKIPCVLVLQFVLTCRYIGVILDEASSMLSAYMLRSPKIKMVRFKDWPMLVSQLFLRSIDRAERVYAAMLCRGFDASRAFAGGTRASPLSIAAFVAFCAACIFLRIFNLSDFFGKAFCG